MHCLNQESGRNWHLFHGDSCEVVKGLPDASVGMCLYSPPFSNLYIYSDSIADMGNSSGHEEFARHYSFLAGELLRITKPGRLCVVHCKDLPLYKNRDGSMGLFDFPGLLMRVHLEAGWVLHSKVTIWKDPVTEMQRTKNHGLLYKELCKDSCGSRQGMADYLLVFRAWTGDFGDPVSNGGERFDSYVGTEPPDTRAICDEFGFPRHGRWPKRNPFPPGSEAFRVWSIKVWQKYASPVWADIDQMRTLNERVAREAGDEKHICPLQLDVIERAVHLWTNPGDVVFTPFAGIGSELYGAVSLGRKAVGCELKGSYFSKAAEFLRVLESDLATPTFTFDKEPIAC